MSATTVRYAADYSIRKKSQEPKTSNLMPRHCGELKYGILCLLVSSLRDTLLIMIMIMVNTENEYKTFDWKRKGPMSQSESYGNPSRSTR